MEYATKIITSSDLEEAASLLKKGELVAFPTETVYGLGAPLSLPTAIKKIFNVKGRPSDNPLIVHVASVEDLTPLVSEIDPLAHRLLDRFFPGPLTIVFKKTDRVPSIVSAGLDTVAIRMPEHPIAQALIKLVKEPLVAPSANLSGKPSATSASHVLEDFQGKIAAVVEGGNSKEGIESTVVYCCKDRVELLRPGVISKEEIEECLQTKLFLGTKILSPGMKYRHYQPHSKVLLFSSQHLAERYCQTKKKRIVLGAQVDGERCYPLTAKDLYALFRLSDQLQCEEVVVVADASTSLGLMNRLAKASIDMG